MLKVTIYTDGACSGNPGPGGWGAVLMHGEHKKEISGGEKDTTNNKMELMAAIKALESLKNGCEVDIYSDSAYLINAFEKGWLDSWQQKGWRTASKDEVKNQDLWKRLLQLSNIHKINWLKVKGHSDNEFNNRCDELARDAIVSLLKVNDA